MMCYIIKRINGLATRFERFAERIRIRNKKSSAVDLLVAATHLEERGLSDLADQVHTEASRIIYEYVEECKELSKK